MKNISKILIVFYSLSGRTKYISEIIKNNLKKDELNISVLEVEDKKSRKGIFNFFKSGYEAIFEKLPPINFNNLEFDNFDLVIIGSPTWAGRLSSPMRSFLTENGKKFKNVAFFCTAGSIQKKVFEDMEKLTKAPLATLFIKDFEKEPEIKEKVINFINNLL
jgi:flavodoxin